MTNWTSFVRRHFATRLRALACVPHAQPHEAPNSWFMRAAAMQGCSPKEFASYLGFEFGHDFDSQYYYAFAKEAPYVPEVKGLELSRGFMGGRQQLGLPLRASNGRWGRYRFCPLCLRDDQTPCFHLYCRMEQLVFCPWHKCLLEDRCPHCNAHVELTVDMAEPRNRLPGVGDLSWCLMCRQPLHRASPVFIDYSFMQQMPYWLRHWGGGGPAPVEGHGADKQVLVAERERLLATEREKCRPTPQCAAISPLSASRQRIEDWLAGPYDLSFTLPHPRKPRDLCVNESEKAQRNHLAVPSRAR